MSKNLSASALLMANIKLFNDATTLLVNGMEEHLSEAFQVHLDEFAKANPWTVKSDPGEVYFWLFPKSWDKTPANARTRKLALAWFELESLEPGDETYYWIPQLCDVSSDGEAGIALHIDNSLINRDAWSGWCTNIPSDVAKTLKDHGFEYREEHDFLFRPIKLNPTALANAWDSSVVDLSKAVSEVGDALNDMVAVAQAIDPILKKFTL